MMLQAKVVPTIPLEVPKATLNGSSEQLNWLSGVAVATGSGSTVTLKVMGSPGHSLGAGPVGVTSKSTVTAAPVRFVIVRVLISPLPERALAVTPGGSIEVMLQAKVVPTMLLLVLKTTPIGSSEQTVWLAGVATARGSGSTSTTTSIGSPIQSSPL